MVGEVEEEAGKLSGAHGHAMEFVFPSVGVESF